MIRRGDSPEQPRRGCAKPGWSTIRASAFGSDRSRNLGTGFPESQNGPGTNIKNELASRGRSLAAGPRSGVVATAERWNFVG